MAVLAFGWSREAVKKGGLFLLLSLSLGGMAMCFTKRNFAALTLGATGIWLLCRVAFGDGAVGREFVPVTLYWGTRQASFTALRDTGNTLRDPITGEPVLVVSGKIGEKLTGLSRQQMAAPLETLAAGGIPGARLVPYHAVGTAGGMLLALPLLAGTGKERRRVLVAFAPEGLENGRYQGLTGGAI